MIEFYTAKNAKILAIHGNAIESILEHPGNTAKLTTASGKEYMLNIAIDEAIRAWENDCAEATANGLRLRGRYGSIVRIRKDRHDSEFELLSMPPDDPGSESSKMRMVSGRIWWKPWTWLRGPMIK